MRISIALLLALGSAASTLVPAAAQAQEEICQPYNHTQFRADLDGIYAALDAMDLKEMRRILSDTRTKIRCIDEIVDPTMLAEFGRLMALVFFFDQDADSTRRWGLLARYSDPNLPWDDSMFPEDHPFRSSLEEEDDPILGGPDDMGLLPPPKGGIFMNGQFLQRPEAPAEVPVFMQVADKKGVVVAGFWQDGARFPDPILGPPGELPVAPKWWSGPTVAAVAVASVEPEPEPEPGPQPEPIEPEPVVPDPVPEPHPTGEGLFADGVPITRLAISGGLLVGAGVMVGIAAGTHAKLDDTDKDHPPSAIRTTVNVCTLTAGVMALGAIGVGATIFFIDDGAGVGLNVRW